MGGGGDDQFHGIPEKYRVNDAGGKFDLAASARKVAGGYGELATRMKDVGLPPESPDKYELAATTEADKELFGKLLAEDVSKAFLKDAHSKGLSSAQANLAMNYALTLAKSIGTAVLNETKDECLAALEALPSGKGGVQKILDQGKKAALAFGGAVGIKFEEIEAAGLANNPIFCRLMAAIGGEMSEDLPAPGDAGGGEGKSFEVQVAEITAELEKLELHDPKRKELLARKQALYDRKFPSRQPAFKGAA
jgi:hypothetical protein